jgi:hypothetical protein
MSTLQTPTFSFQAGKEVIKANLTSSIPAESHASHHRTLLCFLDTQKKRFGQPIVKWSTMWSDLQKMGVKVGHFRPWISFGFPY